MRGTQSHQKLRGRQDGIIPAYAGNTLVGHPEGRLAEDHPRVCGEHRCRAGIARLCGGSSPRMRGTLVQVVERAVGAGIIPAYAGNTVELSMPM